MILNFYKSIPAEAVLWNKANYFSADVSFQNYDKFKQAVLLGDPILNSYKVCIRSSFLKANTQKYQNNSYQNRDYEYNNGKNHSVNHANSQSRNEYHHQDKRNHQTRKPYGSTNKDNSYGYENNIHKTYGRSSNNQPYNYNSKQQEDEYPSKHYQSSNNRYHDNNNRNKDSNNSHSNFTKSSTNQYHQNKDPSYNHKSSYDYLQETNEDINDYEEYDTSSPYDYNNQSNVYNVNSNSVKPSSSTINSKLAQNKKYDSGYNYQDQHHSEIKAYEYGDYNEEYEDYQGEENNEYQGYQYNNNQQVEVTPVFNNKTQHKVNIVNQNKIDPTYHVDNMNYPNFNSEKPINMKHQTMAQDSYYQPESSYPYNIHSSKLQPYRFEKNPVNNPKRSQEQPQKISNSMDKTKILNSNISNEPPNPYLYRNENQNGKDLDPKSAQSTRPMQFAQGTDPRANFKNANLNNFQQEHHPDPNSFHVQQSRKQMPINAQNNFNYNESTVNDITNNYHSQEDYSNGDKPYETNIYPYQKDPKQSGWKDYSGNNNRNLNQGRSAAQNQRQQNH